MYAVYKCVYVGVGGTGICNPVIPRVVSLVWKVSDGRLCFQHGITHRHSLMFVYDLKGRLLDFIGHYFMNRDVSRNIFKYVGKSIK
jgi:hypothetical protein